MFIALDKSSVSACKCFSLIRGLFVTQTIRSRIIYSKCSPYKNSHSLAVLVPLHIGIYSRRFVDLSY